jgi:pyruvate, water dikinase
MSRHFQKNIITQKKKQRIYTMDKSYIRSFDTLTIKDVAIAGGKNASLGEMLRTLKEKDISVPDGFATTAHAYDTFIEKNDLKEIIVSEIKKYHKKTSDLKSIGKNIRNAILESTFPDDIEKDIFEAYDKLCERYKTKNVDVAVRSSATAEDLPDASFAGQQDTYLNIKGKHSLIEACIKCYSSLFTDRAIAYRDEKGFDHFKIALSIGVQKMIRSDKAGSGVMFSIDTESGFDKVVVINAAFGLGENVVQGTVNPDEYVVFKPLLEKKGFSPILEKKLGKKEKKMIYARSGKDIKNKNTSKKERLKFVLTDEEIVLLGKWAVEIEKHYKKPMDMEWAKDGFSKKLYIVQARPETVQSRRNLDIQHSFALKEKSKVLVEGLAIGEMIATGKVQVIKNIKDISKFKKGSVLVTQETSPDWVPIMKMASAIVTDHGGRTSHAAIVSRELGVTAIVGTNDATKLLKDNIDVTVCCSEGDIGYVFDKILKYDVLDVDLSKLPKISTKLMLNIATPSAAFHWWHLPCQGIGLARMEFIIDNIIKIHPMALVNFKKLKDKKAKKEIEKLTIGYKDKTKYFVDHLAKGISKIAASQYPHPVIVRMSDFKSNEYANLIGGREFEPKEENPMIGFRGASRYYSDKYKPGFNLECEAILEVREKMGLDNVIIMIPFCRTLEEADKVFEVLKENGLERGKNNLQIYVMCEIPSNVVLAKEFAKKFDGFSIGSNDLTQLTLGVDRDAQDLASIFDERNEAVKRLISDVIKIAHENNTKVGICGQGPSDHPDFAQFLITCGIDTISLNPDSVIAVIPKIAELEQKQKK